MKKIVGGMVVAVGMAVALSPVAHAERNGFCDLLDGYPSDATITLVGMGAMSQSGGTAYEVGQTMARVVATECPEHMGQLLAWAERNE